MNAQEKQLIIESIVHWQEDILDMFEAGYTIYNPKNVYIPAMWKEINKVVKIGSNNCSLCKKYMSYINEEPFDILEKDYPCTKCPWYRACGRECYKQEYMYFTTNFSKKAAQDVIEKLWRIGTNNLKKGDTIYE